MDYKSSPVCAKEFFERAAATSNDGSDTALLEVRRFANDHDTAEFATTQQVIVSCRLGGCAVTLSQVDGKTEVSAPGYVARPV